MKNEKGVLKTEQFEEWDTAVPELMKNIQLVLFC